MQDDNPRWWRRWAGGLAVVALFALHAAANLVWTQRDQSMRSFDAGPHVEATARALSVVEQQGWLSGGWRVVRGENAGTWPSAGYLPRVAGIALLGASLANARRTNLLYLALLLAGVYLVGRRLHGRWAGVVAAALVALYPGVYGESRGCGADFPAAAMVAVGLAALLATDGLTRLRRGATLGVVVGLAVLVRPHTLFVLGPAGLALALGSAWNHGRRPWRVLATCALSVGLAAAVSSPWWVGRLVSIANWFVAHGSASDVRGSNSIHHNILGLFEILSLPLLLCWALALVLPRLPGRLFALSTRGRAPATERGVVWAGLAGGIVMWAVQTATTARYLVPLSPMVAVITGAGLASLRGRTLANGLAAFFVYLATVTWFADSFVVAKPLDHRRAVGWSGKAKLHLANGPPRLTSAVPFARRAGALLGRRHGRGDGVVVRLTSDMPGRGENLRLSWYVSPILRLALPAVLITGDTYFMRRGPRPYHALGGAAVPDIHRTPPRHCYLLRLDHHRPVMPPPPPAASDLMLRANLEHGWLVGRVSLWRLARCTPEAATVRRAR